MLLVPPSLHGEVFLLSSLYSFAASDQVYKVFFEEFIGSNLSHGADPGIWQLFVMQTKYKISLNLIASSVVENWTLCSRSTMIAISVYVNFSSSAHWTGQTGCCAPGGSWQLWDVLMKHWMRGNFRECWFGVVELAVQACHLPSETGGIRVSHLLLLLVLPSSNKSKRASNKNKFMMLFFWLLICFRCW